MSFKKFGKAVSSVILFSIFCLPVYAATNEELKQKADSLAGQLETINNQMKEKQDALDTISKQNKTISSEIKTREYSIKTLDLGIRSNEIKIEKLNVELEGLSNDLSAAQDKITEKRALIGSMIKQLDKKEQSNFLEMILSGRSLSDAVMELDSLSRIQTGLNEEIINLRNLSQEIDTDIQSSKEKKIDMASESGSLKVRKSEVEDQKSEYNKLLGYNKNQQSVYQKQLSDLEKKQQDIANQIDKLEEDIRAAAGVAPKVSTKMIYPLKSYKITQYYGASASASKLYSTGFHNGMDFGVPIGTPVYAAQDGKIIAAGNNGKYQYGKHILIEHENNLVTIYGHLSSQSVSVGQKVTAGQLIGYSGNTGYSTGAHLHFGVYFEQPYCRTASRTSGDSKCVQLKVIGAAGLVPVGPTVNPLDYLSK